MALLRGVALLSRGEVLATLPSEEALPLTDRQALQRLPEVFGPRKGFGAFGLGLRASTRTASDAAPGVAAERSTRCFCSVLEEWPRVYAAAVALELSGRMGCNVCGMER
ncbi:unnamed protein product [Durusdinium trenchii]|uniref:Uncharacterized protein n=1 Tax=Durusdinium trenchii TaxID=1381693 RepID=A0ABP0SH59_9DINO